MSRSRPMAAPTGMQNARSACVLLSVVTLVSCGGGSGALLQSENGGLGGGVGNDVATGAVVQTVGATAGNASGGTSAAQGGSGPTGGTDAGGVMASGGTGTPGGSGGGSTTSGGGGGSTTSGGGGSGGTDAYSGPFKILVLDTALQFAHDSIPICDLTVGLESFRTQVEADRKVKEPANLGATPDAMMPMGTKPGSQWTADHAKNDLTDFTDANLKQYAMVFSCSPTGTVFSNNPNVKDKATSATAMAALQKFVESGGAFGGVHSASDFENSNGFPWFTNTLMGGYFVSHENDGTNGTVQVVSTYATHPVMRGVPATWSTVDEWYHMNRDIGAQPGFQILARLAVDNRPIVWIKEVSKGRMFYTVRGHNKDRFDKEPAFRTLMLNGILWATHRLEQ
ncbi:MAG: ThuA domain-containing protein [Polyangiaceae bacterium]